MRMSKAKFNRLFKGAKNTKREKVGRVSVKPEMSSLEAQFALMWRSLGGPELVMQHRFHPVRKWRMDFAHLETMVAIEIHGGIYGMSRHTTGTGFRDDREKMNAAQSMGWVVFEVVTGFTLHEVEKILEFVRGRMNNG